MLNVRTWTFPAITAIALFFSFLQLHYALSIVVGGALLCIVVTLVIVSSQAQINKYLYSIVLIYSLVSMDLGPFSRSVWSSETFGSGFINTPLTKFFLLFLVIHAILIRKSLITCAGFVLLSFLVILGEGSNLIFLGTTLSTWSMLMVLFILALNSPNPKNLFIDPGLAHFVLRVSVYAVGLRIFFYLITNLLGYTDYLTFGQRPVISSLYVLSSVLLRKKIGLIDFVFLMVGLIPIGKGDLIHLLIVATLIPRMFLALFPIFVVVTFLFPNELIFIKLVELANILNLENISTLLGVAISSSDAGSVGTRVSEFISILSSIANYPHSIVFGLNGIGITADSVSSLGGELTNFDYSDQEFSSGIIVNVHGFYNKLLYTTGFAGALMYIVLILLYANRIFILTNFRLNSMKKSFLISVAIGIAILFQFYLSPELAIIYSAIANTSIRILKKSPNCQNMTISGVLDPLPHSK